MTTLIAEVLPFTIIPANDENGEPNCQLGLQADAIARDRNMHITRDRELYFIAVNDVNSVVGAAWLSFDGDNFTFDVAVSSNYERQGIGSALTDAMLGERSYYQEVSTESTMLIHVISPRMRAILEARGFVVTQILGKNNLIMGLEGENSQIGVGEG